MNKTDLASLKLLVQVLNSRPDVFGALLAFIGLDMLNGEEPYLELWDDANATQEGEKEDE